MTSSRSDSPTARPERWSGSTWSDCAGAARRGRKCISCGVPIAACFSSKAAWSSASRRSRGNSPAIRWWKRSLHSSAPAAGGPGGGRPRSIPPMSGAAMPTKERAATGPQAPGAASVGEPIAIVCGGGSFPGAVAEAIARRGRRPVMFGVRGWADPKVVERYAHHWIAIGQAGRFFRLARFEQCRDVLFIGTMLRPPLTQIRLDWQSIRLMPRVVRFFRGGDDRLLSGLASLMEDGGLRIIGIKEAAPEIIVQSGVLGRCQPLARDRADIAYALKLIAVLGSFDVGQA